uniref:probable receptor-like protein kinase At5g20050 n=1 Tax=Erigeron canadensis TaxID=72917 RepID=UPI001CB9263E|nr:probable receptor-like protein kinase At5g20050 [Erigeron canadensis]
MSSSSNSKITHFIKESEHLCIPFQDIQDATKSFTTVIGKGGYGLVYKGELLLSNKLTSVAIKRLDSNISGQGLKEFLREIELLSRFKHPNLVSLLGFCEENGEKMLVYEYAERGSLDKYLTKGESTVQLTWLQRINICIDAARGLDYLHNHVAQDRRVIHRDIKSANILLSHDWKAMIADFGLSLISRAHENVSFIITNVSGTHGYCDPEYLHTGILTKESDVYSFGVVMFEVLCGTLSFVNVNSEQGFLAHLAKRYYKEGRLHEIIDPCLKIEVDPDSLNTFSTIAIECLHNNREQRPSMGLVLQKLEEMIGINNTQVASTYLWPKTLAEPVLDPAKAAMKRPVGILHVKVVRAMKLEEKNIFGASDPYVQLKLTKNVLPSKKTTVKFKNLNPEWNEEFNFVVKDPGSQALMIVVYNWEQVGKHEKMGMNVVPLKEVTPDEEKVMTLELLKNMDPYDAQNEKSRGQIIIELSYKPFTIDEVPTDDEDENAIEMAPDGTPVGGGLLVVKILHANDLEGKHHTNPYVCVLFRGEERKTKLVKKNRDPIWGEEFAFILEEPPTNDRIHFEVVSTSSRMGLIHPKETLGYVDIQLADVVSNKRINGKYNLTDSRNGTLQVELQWRTSS